MKPASWCAWIADGDDWRGLVRAVSLNAQLQGSALTIDQSAELERHLAEIA